MFILGDPPPCGIGKKLLPVKKGCFGCFVFDAEGNATFIRLKAKNRVKNELNEVMNVFSGGKFKVCHDGNADMTMTDEASLQNASAK